MLADCTLGIGGHAEGLLSSMPEDAKLIGIDKDEESLSLARDRLKKFKGRFYPQSQYWALHTARGILKIIFVSPLSGITQKEGNRE